MNKEITSNSGSSVGPRVRARLRRLRMSRRQGMLGPAEIAGVAGSAVILLITAISYFYFLVPARSQLQSLELERSRLQNQLRNSQEVMRQGQDTQVTVDKITESLTAFESNRLANRNQGRMALYQELNQLIRQNGLRNTSGPAYVPLDTVGTKSSTTGSKSASTKWQSMYPGIGITLTVEGQYQNLRRLVRSLEASRQFLIINAIELERATQSNTAVSAEAGSTTVPREALVSLRLDMVTYFQRETEEGTTLNTAVH
jgi:Tfp pilus assembly protein PilO